MIRIKLLNIVPFILCMFAMACSKENDEGMKVDEKSYKVAMIVPETNMEGMKRTAEWALSNIRKAQEGLPLNICLELEWKNQDDTDLERYLDLVGSDESYVAVVGPIGSELAPMAAEACNVMDKPLILPVSTSTEFQRVFSGDHNIWNLAQSDITQCEIMLTQAVLFGQDEVSLLTSDDDYGRSFSDWFAYQATELHLEVNEVMIYSDESQLREYVHHLPEYSYSTMLLFAPSSEDDALTFDDEVKKILQKDDNTEFPTMLCSDVCNSPVLKDKLTALPYEGISPCANPTSGFINAYQAKFADNPSNGEANMFDALHLLAYALTLKEGNEEMALNDAIQSIVNVEERSGNNWMIPSMKQTFNDLQNGRIPEISGTIGDWTFDKPHYSSVLNTVYDHWILRKNEYTTLEYLSTDGFNQTISTMQAWDTHAKNFQEFDINQKDFKYTDLNEKWAVIVGASTEWKNYRHQADALAMYQLLKKHGYDDDHIILIIEDNMAYHERNIHQGVVRVKPDGMNLYKNVEVDYKLKDIEIEDLGNIFMGNRNDKLGQVIESTANDNVLMFWCGHGGRNLVELGEGNPVYAQSVRDIVEKMSEQKKFRKMFCIMETCYSGSMAEACEGIPGLLFLTSANAYESSKADIKDPDMKIWLSNSFTHALLESLDKQSDISMRDLYYNVSRQTFGSHAMMYNMSHYGNLFKNNMSEFLQ